MSPNSSHSLLCTTLNSLNPIASLFSLCRGVGVALGYWYSGFAPPSKRELEKPRLAVIHRWDASMAGAQGGEKGGDGGPGAEIRGGRLCFESTRRRNQNHLRFWVKWVFAGSTFSNDDGYYAVPGFKNRREIKTNLADVSKPSTSNMPLYWPSGHLMSSFNIDDTPNMGVGSFENKN